MQQSWVSEGMAEGTGTTFFLDGAHTPESMATCAEWFFEASHTQQDPGLLPHRILLFNCMKVLSSLMQLMLLLHVRCSHCPYQACTCNSC